MHILTVTVGEQAGTTFELARRPLTIGRDPSRDIQIMDMKVSRKHAMIRHEDGEHVLSVMRSTNPLRINGREVTGDEVLCHSDQIQMGDTILRFDQNPEGEYTNAVHHRKRADKEARDANTLM